MKLKDDTRKTIKMMRSRLGDVVLQCDKVNSKGEIVQTEIVMFVPKPVQSITIDNEIQN